MRLLSPHRLPDRRPPLPGYCLLGNGSATVTFDSTMEGASFFFLDEQGCRSDVYHYNHSTGWLLPYGKKVWWILFSSGEIYYCQEGDGLEILDYSPAEHHGSISEDVWGTQAVYSLANVIGYSTKSWYDSQGWTWPLTSEEAYVYFEPREFTGEANVAPRLKGAGCADLDVGSTISFSDLSGVTILGYRGTSTVIINGNDIEATSAGTLYMLVLSDGTTLPLDGSLYDVSGAGNHPTASSGVSYTTQDEVFYMARWGCSVWDGSVAVPNLLNGDPLPVLPGHTRTAYYPPSYGIPVVTGVKLDFSGIPEFECWGNTEWDIADLSDGDYAQDILTYEKVIAFPSVKRLSDETSVEIRWLPTTSFRRFQIGDTRDVMPETQSQSISVTGWPYTENEVELQAMGHSGYSKTTIINNPDPIGKLTVAGRSGFSDKINYTKTRNPRIKKLISSGVLT